MNILYSDLFDEIIDRLDNFVSRGDQVGEFMRRKYSSDTVIARAVSSAMIEFCRGISHVSVPDLVQTVNLTYEGKTINNIYSYSFPSNAMHERGDAGVISFILNCQHVAFENSVPYEQVVAKGRISMYDGSESIYNIDIGKRRLYVAKVKDAQALIFKRPHSAFSASQNMFHGVTLEVTAVSSGGTITLSDGIGNTVDIAVLAGDTVAVRAGKIVDAVIAAETFGYNAVISASSDSTVQLYARHGTEVDVNEKLNPSLADAGTGTYVLADTGTYELPVPYHFINVLASSSFALLLSQARQEVRDQLSEVEPETESEQS